MPEFIHSRVHSTQYICTQQYHVPRTSYLYASYPTNTSPMYICTCTSYEYVLSCRSMVLCTRYSYSTHEVCTMYLVRGTCTYVHYRGIPALKKCRYYGTCAEQHTVLCAKYTHRYTCTQVHSTSYIPRTYYAQVLCTSYEVRGTSTCVHVYLVPLSAESLLVLTTRVPFFSRRVGRSRLSSVER